MWKRVEQISDEQNEWKTNKLTKVRPKFPVDKKIVRRLVRPLVRLLRTIVLYFVNFQTISALEYHVVPKYISRDNFYNGQQYPTMLGANYTVKLTKGRGTNGVSGGLGTIFICNWPISILSFLLTLLCSSLFLSRLSYSQETQLPIFFRKQ